MQIEEDYLNDEDMPSYEEVMGWIKHPLFHGENPTPMTPEEFRARKRLPTLAELSTVEPNGFRWEKGEDGFAKLVPIDDTTLISRAGKRN